ncbi:MAG TPA: FAD-linked oxidase C-terminal domain-containing protein [Pyrinomonadaceae bacterium]|nr:FAD-linked oxidase C-terminal domain-containing protein [Pyrinomonadaceae bacterium]
MNSLEENLRAIVGREQLLTDAGELLVYECDGLTHYKARPRAVVFPRSTEEVSEVVRTVTRAGVSFAPRGAGTGLSGGALALNEGVVIELARMRRLLKIDASNRLAIVETGLVNAQLSRAAAPFGLHYAPDPSSQTTCTIGGNIAENAGGIHCLKYGVTVDHVLAARVVLADGEVVDLRSAGAGGEGFDLLGVFVGSEGTFGIATEATLKLTPLPAAVRTLLADFRDVDDASRAVSAIIASGLIPAALEMIDGATIRAVEASVFTAGLPTDAGAALLVELDGLAAGLDAEAERAESICLQHGARGVRRAADERERGRLWAARKGAFGAMGRITPDLMLQDAVVPRSRLPEVLAAIYRTGEKFRLRVANVFHAGDGNLHPYICFDARDPDEVERVHEASREMMETCVRAGGTITGEHGVGMDKSQYLPLVFSADDMEAMLRVRAAFDPSGLCNSCKIIPVARGCGEARVVATRGSRDAVTQPHESAGTQQQPRDDERWEAMFSNSTAVNPSQTSATDEASSERFSASNKAEPIVATSQRLSVGASLQQRLSGIVGDDNVSLARVGESCEAVAVAPASFEEACEVLRLASREDWKVLPVGGRTWLDAGGTPRRVDVLIETRLMTRLVEHEPADLVATAEAGMTLDAFNATLLPARQWLPLDPPDDGRATLGGITATGLAGAHACVYGPPRAFVLGMRVALADGRIIKAGGRVVKNVAGYDLCKLFTGSYGTLGLILELTFKLRPRPAREATALVRATDYHALLAAARSLPHTHFLPVALELLSPRMARAVAPAHNDAQEDADGYALLARFAGTQESVAAQLAQAREHFGRAHGIRSVETHADDAHIWRTLAAVPLQHDNAAPLIWRAGVLPTELGPLLEAYERGVVESVREPFWHAGVADGRLRVVETFETDTETTISRLERLRTAARASGGSLVLERAAPEVKSTWAALNSHATVSSRLMRRIKQQLDPRDTFSTARVLEPEP